MASGTPLPLFLLGGVATYIATFLICSESNIIVIEKQISYNTQKYLSISCVLRMRKNCFFGSFINYAFLESPKIPLYVV